MMDRQFMVRVSYLEIYNGQVTDLLSSPVAHVDLRQKQVSFILFCLYITSSAAAHSCPVADYAGPGLLT